MTKSGPPVEVLIIEDDPQDYLFVQELLKEQQSERIKLTHADLVSKGHELLQSSQFDAILCDLNLPDSHGLDTFYATHAVAPKVPIIVFTGLDDEDIGIKAVQEGAQDYLVKGRVDSNLLVKSIRYAIERKAIEDALFSEKERLAVTLRSIGDGVIAIKVDGTVTVLNKVAENLTGWSQEEAEGKDFSDIYTILDEKTRQPLPNPLEKVLLEGRVVGRSDYTILISRSGTEYFIYQRGAPILDKDEKVIGAVMSFRDITSQKRLERELIELGQIELLGDIVMTRIVVEFPEDIWLTEASRRFPTVTFEIQSFLPASLLSETPGLIINNALVKIASIEWEKILDIVQTHPSLLSIHKWDVKDDEVLINVKSKDSFILRSLIESECILKYPVLVQDGKGTWEIISPRKKIDALLELFDEMGILYSIASIGSLKKEEGQLALTKRQELVLEQALALGYYELPRRITLTELAEKLNIAKSTLS
ncbi:MAG TPA: response regulator, partial [Candidatus Lokiarchaeia archaeon]|nr:response regulator [Candidatus Lokiarchaeia archaeon]